MKNRLVISILAVAYIILAAAVLVMRANGVM